MAKGAGVKKSYGSLGSLLFLVGAAAAVVVGLLSPGGINAGITSVLILLGLIIGFLNVTTRETNSFLLATVSLVIVTALGGAVLSRVAVVGVYLEGVLLAILTFIIPAAIIVALKSVYSLAASK
ncbi:hypothetical protein J4470_02990 [Candidatus Woesearchaeota archaeon]|nr:hypothetical protein [Candidatus Woesearchaeota archaeon]